MQEEAASTSLSDRRASAKLESYDARSEWRTGETPFEAGSSGAVKEPHPKGNNLDSVRQHNLSTVLEMVHRSGQVSRSVLAKRTGLNRSTIAALVGELTELRLVTEAAPDTTTQQVGRPSSIVSPSPQTVAIAVNPEIDAITLGIVGLGGVVQRKVRFATDGPPSVREAVKISVAVFEGMRGGLGNDFQIVGIGMAIPGLIRSPDGLVRLAPHLNWRDEPVPDLLAAATGFPVWAANDARLGALAERTFGTGIGVRDMLYLNGGASGIGGGIIVGGTVVNGAGGYGGELGHVRVRSGGRPDTAGLIGTLESEVTREDLQRVLGLSSADADELELALLASDLPAVTDVVNRQIDYLAVALSGAINALNPQLVVLGGFLGSLYAADPTRLEKAVMAQTIPSVWENVRISRPKLGTDILMVGAAELALASLIADPAGFRFVE